MRGFVQLAFALVPSTVVFGPLGRETSRILGGAGGTTDMSRTKMSWIVSLSSGERSFAVDVKTTQRPSPEMPGCVLTPFPAAPVVGFTETIWVVLSRLSRMKMSEALLLSTRPGTRLVAFEEKTTKRP